MSKIGLDCRLYHLPADVVNNSVNNGSRPAWPGSGSPEGLVLITHVRDVTLNVADGKNDASDRGSRFKKYGYGMLDAGIDFELRHIEDDAFRAALLYARANREVIALAVLDGDKDTEGSAGIWADWTVEKLNRKEPLGGEVTYDVSLVPGDSAVEPEEVEVVAGS